MPLPHVGIDRHMLMFHYHELFFPTPSAIGYKFSIVRPYGRSEQSWKVSDSLFFWQLPFRKQSLIVIKSILLFKIYPLSPTKKLDLSRILRRYPAPSAHCKVHETAILKARNLRPTDGRAVHLDWQFLSNLISSAIKSSTQLLFQNKRLIATPTPHKRYGKAGLGLVQFAQRAKLFVKFRSSGLEFAHSTATITNHGFHGGQV